LASGAQIPIEERAAEEIALGFGKQTAPDDVDFYNPAFDVTPGELVSAIITERGVVAAPYVKALAGLFEGGGVLKHTLRKPSKAKAKRKSSAKARSKRAGRG
jgi:hypothetical protein